MSDNHTLTVYVSNMSEDVWPFIQSMSNPYERQAEIIENAGLAEHDLFSFAGRDNLIMVMPKPVGDTYLNYYLGLCDNRNFRILSPSLHTGEISKDIISDKILFEEIVKHARSYKNVEFISYCNSFQFLKLTAEFKDAGIDVITPESPSEPDSWTVDFYGSKSGIRQLSQQSEAREPDFRMPPGIISINIENTARMAATTYIRENGLVIKTNKGHAGAGLFIFRENDLPRNFQKCVAEILKLFRKENYWSKFPIIVEKYIEPAMSIGGGYPNVEFKIHRNGKVEFLYYCALRVTQSGVFKGVEINNSVLSDQDTAQIMDTGFFLGEQLASRGYRGYYELDFVAAKNGDIFVTESNVRRTGGSHAFHAARFFFGKDFMYDTFVVTNNLFKLPKSTKPMEGKVLLSKLAPVLFDKKKKEGVIIAGLRLLERNQFGYIIFGHSKSRANKIEAEMEKLLE